MSSKVSKCCIKGCKSTNRKETLVKVPGSIEVQNNWCFAVNNATGQWLKPNDKICIQHFSKDCILEENGRLLLEPDAVPSIFGLEDSTSILPKRIKTEVTDIHVSCSVVDCRNIYGLTKTYKPNVQYHSFPTNQHIAEEWKSFCHVTSSDLENYYVCSEHFREEDYEERAIKNNENSRIKILRPNAIPSTCISNIKTEILDLNDTSLVEDNTVLEITTTIESSNSDEQNGEDSLFTTSGGDTRKNRLFSISGGDSDAVSSQTANVTNTNEEKICDIKNCESRGSTIEYYSFPTTVTTRTRWLEQIKHYTNQTDINPSTALVCSLHFKPHLFRTNARNGGTYLLSSAVPSIFQTGAASVEQNTQDRLFSTSGGASDAGSSQTLNATHTNNEKNCVIRNCVSRGSIGEYYSFPTIPRGRDCWLEQIKYYTNQTDINPSTAVVCCLHFKPDMFCTNTTNRSIYLSPSAIPTIFPSGTSYTNTYFPKMTEAQIRNANEVRTHFHWFERNHLQLVANIELLNNQLKAQNNKVITMSRSISNFLVNNYISDEVNERLQNMADACIDTQLSII